MTSPSPAPLTPAEQAVADALRANPFGCHMNGEVCDECAESFRAVVAAVRPLIAEETLRQTAKYLFDHRRDDPTAFDLWQMYEAGGPEWLSSRASSARQSLSLPASKETEQ